MRLRHSVSASSNATADATSPIKNVRQPKPPHVVLLGNAFDYFSKRIVNG